MNDKPKDWAVVILKGLQPNGKKIWNIVYETDDAQEAALHLERYRGEGYTANLVQMKEEAK